MDFLQEIEEFKEFFKRSKFCLDAHFVIKTSKGAKDILISKDVLGNIEMAFRWVDKDRIDLIHSINEELRFDKKILELEKEKLRK